MAYATITQPYSQGSPTSLLMWKYYKNTQNPAINVVIDVATPLTSVIMWESLFFTCKIFPRFVGKVPKKKDQIFIFLWWFFYFFVCPQWYYAIIYDLPLRTTETSVCKQNSWTSLCMRDRVIVCVCVCVCVCVFVCVHSSTCRQKLATGAINPQSLSSSPTHCCENYFHLPCSAKMYYFLMKKARLIP